MNRLGILLSGRGSNFAAIARNIREGKLNAEIAVVIANRASAPGLDLARSLGIPALAIPAQGREREDYDRLLVAALQGHQVHLVCLAGYMRLLSRVFVEAFPQRILNIHPSLLPSFPGLDAQQQALHYGAKVTGCTVHFVDELLDSGPIILQSPVLVEEHDTAESLSARILLEEHRIYTAAIGLVLSRSYRIEGRRVLPDKSQKP